jgi:hypothetical protein
MDFGRALSALTDDNDWLGKLGMAALITAFAILTTPILIGLAGWAILLGYQTQVVRRVRQDERLPLPAWSDYGGLLRLGWPVLLAYLVYLLPNLLVAGCSIVLILSTLNTSFTATSVLIGLVCCLVPLLLLYNALIVPLFALGLGRYTTDPVVGVFFDFSRLWSEMSARWGLTGMYLLYMFGFSVVQGVLGAIPIIGWALALAVLVPVNGVLGGQYARAAQGAIGGKKRK